MHVSSPPQLILIHCPGEIAAEMDALCKRNFMRRTDFMMMAIRSLLDYMESAAAEETERLRHQVLNGEEPLLLPADLPGEEATLYPGEDDSLLYAAEEEE